MFGVPKALVADNRPIFISEEFNRLCKRFGITLHHSSPYYPQGNGQAEATNKTLIKNIKKTIEDTKGSDWSDKLVNGNKPNTLCLSFRDGGGSPI